MYRYHIKNSNGKVVERFVKFSDMISYAIEFRLDDTYTLERIEHIQPNKSSMYSMYCVFDNTGHKIAGGFKRKFDAVNYCIIHNRPDWTVKEICFSAK